MTNDTISVTKTHYSFEEFISIISRLRAPDGCPWDREQTHESLKTCMIEEAYEVLEGIDLDGIKMKGYGFQIEMKYTAVRKGFKVKEVPVIFVNRKAGTSKMSGSIFGEAFWGVIGLRFRK